VYGHLAIPFLMTVLSFALRYKRLALNYPNSLPPEGQAVLVCSWKE
jgi:hypothetical protein